MALVNTECQWNRPSRAGYDRQMEPIDITAGGFVLADGGMETTMIFDRGIELPLFSSFVLLEDEKGRAALRDYYVPYLALAERHGVRFLLDTPTWRANGDWGAQLGYSAAALDAVNRSAAAFVQELRAASGRPDAVVCAGVLGPRGDGYQADERLSAEEAQAYHGAQVASFAAAGLDMVAAYTLTHTDEAIGIVRAAQRTGLPVSVGVTVETDGRLPSGEGLREAIERIDGETGAGAAFFLVNCAHPTHFEPELRDGGAWLGRIGGVRANASTKSHAELDAAADLDSGDPQELADRYVELRALLPNLTVIGGCCGTNDRHVAAICDALFPRI